MERLFRALRPVIEAVVARPFAFIVVALALSVLGGVYAARLRVDSDFANLIPPSYPSVQALERLRENVGGESEAAVAIESPSFDANRRFAEAFIPRALALARAPGAEAFFVRVDYRRDTAFIRDNALYLATGAELDSLETFLNGLIEQARLEANPFYFDIGDLDSTDASSPDALADSAAARLELSYDRLVGKDYPISDDSTTLVLRFFPSTTQTDVAFIEAAYAGLQSVVDSLGPARYHPAMKVVLAGRMLRQAVEVRAITDDVQKSFGSGVALVILLVVGFFVYKSYKARAGRHWRPRVLASELARSPVLALAISLPLLASLLWTFGVAYAVYDDLNLMTSTLGLVLFGMGIDYGIHFYGRYAEERGKGLAPPAAAVRTFLKTGEAIATTALTTAAAFFLFMFADFKGFSEFGFIAGTGLVFALLAMIFVLPAFLVLFERLRWLNIEAHPGALEAREGGIRQGRIGAVRPKLFASLALLVGALALLPSVQFQYDFGALDPAFKGYQSLQNYVRRVYNDRGRRNPAYIVADSAAEVPALEAALRSLDARTRAAGDTLIGAVETLQSRFPLAPAAQAAKLARLDTVRALLDDAFLRQSDDPTLARLRAAAGTTRPLALEELPPAFRQAFVTKQGAVGTLVVIYPAKALSDGRNSIAFHDAVGTIRAAGRDYHPGSTQLVAADMLKLMQHEAPLMVAFTLLLIIVLKIASLRSVKWAFVALAPLLMGFAFMFGVMVLFGWKLNFYNMIVLPAVLGIGDDAGIHLVHRYQEEGHGSMPHVMRSTGESVIMSALTAMIGFGGQILSQYPGLKSIGQLAFVGIGMTLLTAVVFLPALVQWLEDRGQGVE